MNIKIKINRLCLILICAALLRGDSNNEKPQTHYLAPVNIIKKQKPLTKCKGGATRHIAPEVVTQQCAVNDK